MGEAAEAAGVSLVAGDTKVVGKGSGDGCYINTTGVGLLPPDRSLGIHTARPGDAVIVSGPVGDHGVTVMLARGELDIEADLVSDTACLAEPCARLLTVPGVRAMRDATRGGVATVLNEIARAAEVSVVVDEGAVPVRDEVRRVSCWASIRSTSPARAGSSPSSTEPTPNRPYPVLNIRWAPRPP